MSMSLQELEKVISEERTTYLQAGRLVDEQGRAPTEQFRRDLKQISSKTAGLQKSLATQEGSLLSTTKKPRTDVPQRSETPTPKARAGQEASQKPFTAFGPPDIPSDVYEQMKRQLYSFFQKALEPPPVVKQAEEPPGGSEQTLEEEQASEAEALSEVTMAVAKAKAIMGSYKSLLPLQKIDSISTSGLLSSILSRADTIGLPTPTRSRQSTNPMTPLPTPEKAMPCLPPVNI